MDKVSRDSYLANVTLSLITNIIPFALIGLCSFYLTDWQLMVAFLMLQAASILGMYVSIKSIRQVQSSDRSQRLWHLYEAFVFISGMFWAAMMLPVITTLGQNIGSMFVCVVIIVTAVVTCMITATQRRTTLSFLIGFMLCLIPQTIIYLEVIGPIPLVATIGLIPALIILTNAMRRQNRLMIRTQLEKHHLAEELTNALAEAEYLASRDSLTGLFNRRAFEELAGQIRQNSNSAPLSFILVDLDHFKSINDRFGHGTGDSVLKRTATLISQQVSPLDLVGRGDGAIARWGGEEFILLLRNCSASKASELAQTIRAGLVRLRSTDWPDRLTVTGSFGVAHWAPNVPLHGAIAKADAAMYRAKQEGRNRVCVHADEAKLPELEFS